MQPGKTGRQEIQDQGARKPETRRRFQVKRDQHLGRHELQGKQSGP